MHEPNEKRRDLLTVLDELQGYLEATGKEVVIEFKEGKWELDLINKNKQAIDIPSPGDVKELQDLDEFHKYVSGLPENTDSLC